MFIAPQNSNNAYGVRSLASSTAQRQGAQLAWSLAGSLVLMASYGIALVLHQAQWVTFQVEHTVLWCALPYALAAHWIYRGAGLPVAERTSLLFLTTLMPFFLLMLAFALMQIAYSRGAVLLVYLLSTAWFALGDWRQRRHHGLQLVCLDDTVPPMLACFCSADILSRQDIRLLPWSSNLCESDQHLVADGVVIDRHVSLTDERSRILAMLKLSHVRLYSVEAVVELLTGRKVLPGGQDELWQLDGNPAYDVAKRVMDVTVVLLTLPIWLPLCLAVAMAVRLDSAGPVLFSQIRVGRDGRSFKIWKFRSMRHEAQPQSARFAQLQDERITRVGQRIRRMRLDELPQLVNVLMGDMSLIGPRPEQNQFVEAFATRIPSYTYRHLVRPGLTGWAQMQQGYADSEDGTVVKLSYDLYYVAHYSMALDMLIAYKTIRTVLNGFGAR